MILSLFFLNFASSLDLIEQEVIKTNDYILLLEKKIESLNNFRESLLATNTTIPEGRSWLSWLDNGLTLPNRFNLQSHTLYTKFVSDSDFLPYKQFTSPGFVSCLNDGTVFVYSNLKLLTEFNSGLETQYCACSYAGDEILIGSVDNQNFKVHRVMFNESEKFPVEEVVNRKLFSEDEVVTTAFTQYSRMGKKFWIVGDSTGFLSVFAYDGELIGKVNGKVGQIEQIVKLGQQLIYSGKRRISVFNTGNLEVSSTCETVADIFKVVIDQSPSIIQASLVTGEIITFDTRYSISNGPAFCKAIYRHVARFPGNLASIKGNLLLWAGSSLISFNTTYLEFDSTTIPEYYILPNRYSRSIKSYSLTDNSLLMLSGIDEIRVYSVQNPDFIPVASQSTSFDMGYLRVVAIVVIVVFFVLWKTKNRKTRKDLEVEKLERSLEELQKSMESTTKMSEELTSRFKNVEETTKHLGGLNRMDS